MRFLIPSLISLICHAVFVAGSFTVPVIFTVFYDQNNPADGNIPDSVITQQMNVLNSFTRQIGLSFAVQSLRRLPVPYNFLHGWESGNAVERQMKQNRQGDIQTLNIYTAGFTQTGRGAVSSFPWKYQENPQNDGIIIDYNALPGGKYINFNTGKALVREVGHWAGLFNTYEGGCAGGDLVDDTQAEAYGASGCPTGRKTCPGGLGDDPIHNMMDSTDDTCRTGFTNGQYNRMAQALRQYRAINL